MKMPLTILFVALLLLGAAISAHAGTIIARPMYIGLNDGLVGYWSFDGSSMAADTAYDSSGNGNTGTLTNGPARAIGRIGQALSFDGSNDYVIRDASSPVTAYPVTMCAWFKLNTLPGNNAYRVIVMVGDDASSGGVPKNLLTLHIAESGTVPFGDNNKIIAMDRGASDVATGLAQSSSAAVANRWYYACGVFESSTRRSLYVDGTLHSTDTTSAGGLTGSADRMIAGNWIQTTGDNDPFDGLIDDVRIYNRALSADEIKRLYKMGATTKYNIANTVAEKNLVGYWPLDANTIYGATAYDRSGDGKNGTLTNGPRVDVGRIGQGLTLDGENKNNYLDVSGFTNSTLGSYPLTLSLWAKTDVVSTASSQNQELLSQNGIASDWDFHLATNVKALVFQASSGNVATSTLGVVPDINAWNQYAVTIDASGNVTFYVNGARAGEASGLAALGWTRGNLTVGKATTTTAITTTLLDASVSGDNLTEYTTNSITPSSNALILAAVLARQGSGSSTAVTSMSGNGLTWRKIQTIGLSGSSLSTLSLYCAQGASPSAGAVTITFATGQSVAHWAISEFKDVSTTGDCNTNAVAQIGAASGANPITVTLASFANADNRPFMATGIAITNAISPETGFTELSETTLTSPATEHQTEWHATGPDTTPSSSWTGTPSNAAIAVEIHKKFADMFDGTIDEVRIFNRALSADEIKRLYNGGATAKVNLTLKPTGTLSNGLVGHWSFDGSSMAADTAYDRSGNGNTGTLTNGPTRAIGRIGQALSFDGSDDFVDIFNSQTVPSTFQTIGNNNNYALSAWIKTNKAANGDEALWYCESTIIELRDEDGITKTPFNLGLEDTFLCLGRTDQDNTGAERYLGTISINDGAWHHVAVSVVDNVADFYTDGVFDVQRTYTAGAGNASVGTQTSNMQIGARSNDDGARNSNLFNGLIDDVRIYNRALSPAEVLQLYTLGR